MNKHTRTLIEATRLARKLLNGLLTDNQLDFRQPDGSTAREKLGQIDAALKPFDRAAEAKLAWSYDGNTYSCEIVGHRYEVNANGNEPERSSIRWVATCDGEWMSDGEPRCRDAKTLCVKHAQRAAQAKINSITSGKG